MANRGEYNGCSFINKPVWRVCLSMNLSKANKFNFIASSKLKMPFLFWLGMFSFALFLLALNSFLVYQNQDRVTQAASLSANSLASLVSDYIEKHKTLVKSIASHHNERILKLSKGGGYPYDLSEIKSEFDELLPNDTKFAVVNDSGQIVLGGQLSEIGDNCKRFIEQTMSNVPMASSTVRSHASGDGEHHFDILNPIVIGDEYAGLWVRLSFKPIEKFILNSNIKEYDLVIQEQTPPYNILLGGSTKPTNSPLKFDFISNAELDKLKVDGDVLAIAPILDVPWQVRAIAKEKALGHFKTKAMIASILLFIITFVLVATLILVTRQFQKEREKLKQDAVHDELFNAGPTVLLEKSVDRNMSVLYASPNSMTLLGESSSRLVDKSFLEWVYADDVETVRQQLLQAYKDQKDKVEMVYRLQDRESNSFKWIYDYTHIKYNSAGKPDILRGYITSIHAQKTAEKNATDLIQSVPEAIFVTELDGHIVNMNYAAEKLLDCQKYDLDFKLFSQWLEPESFKSFERAKQRYLQEGTVISEQYANLSALYLRNASGQRISVEISFNQIELNGVPLLVLVVRDVTLQVKTQQQLSHAKEQAEALAKARSRFVATISHEIRTPMNGVLGMTDLLFDTELNALQERYLQAIRQSGSTLLTIINEVLDFAKLDEGRITLAHEAFNLNSLVNECVHLLSPSAEEKQLKLMINYPASVSNQYLGDETRVKQLILNLLSNAIKFTEQGEVKISVDELFDSAGSYKALQITVVDTGIGIEQDNQSRLFDSFTQADDSTARQFGGTGLGLAISKQLVTLMNGEIGVKSVYGEGSEFWVEIPLDRVEDNTRDNLQLDSIGSKSTRNAARPLANKTVLVVEDNEINQEVIKAFLERLGASVDIAENGLKGLDYWRLNHQKYHLILMDCQMPVMDGFESTQMIRKEEAVMHVEQAIPIVALTANVIKEDKEKCLRVGMDDFLAKPIERDTFNEMVVQWCL